VRQELSEKAEKAKEGYGDPKARSDVIAAYRSASKILGGTSSDRSREAKEGLAGAIVADAEFDITGSEPLTEPVKQGLRDRLNSAIHLHNELVEFAWNNSSAGDWAGALRNLASAYILLADLEEGSSDQADTNALREAEKVLCDAVAAYEEAGDESAVSEESNRLAEVQRRMADS
jgi:hypothetical protein